MKYTRYPVVLLLLVSNHFFLSGYIMVIAWFVMGILLAMFMHGRRRLLLNILLLELLTGIGFSIFYWNTEQQLNNLAKNTALPGIAWVAVIISIQAITAFLCITTAYSIVRHWQRYRNNLRPA